MTIKSIFVVLFLCNCHHSFSQHVGHNKHTGKEDSTAIAPITLRSSEGGYILRMTHSFSLTLPMSRNGSGTGWLTDSSPMFGYTLAGKKWFYTFHGNLFLRYNKQDITGKGSRGAEKFDAPNWFMGIGQRRVGQRGLLRFSAMFSLDPIITGGNGYPLLFQSGETYQGKRLVDRQRPHDLISELSIGYSHMLSENTDLFAYFGLPGEPALGPVAFMHRVSALNNPGAPLGHHWQDVTHITFGVATLGLRYKSFKIEGSSFTGREPNEERFGIDKPRFDSYSFRFSVNPNANLAFQTSRLFIKGPESLDVSENVIRTTASVIYNFPLFPLLRKNYNFASSLIWGFNDRGHEHKEHSVTFEPALQLNKIAVYGRYEWIQKTAEELGVDQFEGEKLLKIQALTLGTNYTFLRTLNTYFSFGVQGSLFRTGPELYSIYGKKPLSAEVYIRVNPHLMNMGTLKGRGH